MRLTALLSTSCVALALCVSSATPTNAEETVSIYRDAKGVPHIFAETSAAVMFGAGYAQAQDRLAAMELARRAATGRRAEILGVKFLAADKTARDRQLSRDELIRMYRAIPREHQLMMQAFVDGINRAVAEIQADPGRKTPLEFIRWGLTPTPWTLVDYLGYVASIPNGRGGSEIQNLAFLDAMIARYGQAVGKAIFDDVVPISDPDSPLAIPPGEDLAPPRPMPVSTHLSLTAAGAKHALLSSPVTEGQVEASRCLVIGPRKSASGNVLMMEATSDGPEAHLHGGGFNIAGFSFAGWGAPFMGRAGQHGWLMTSGHADTTDTFAERLNPKDKYQYWFNGKWRTMDHRRETIRVKGQQPEVHEVAWTVHGPVIKWDVAGGVAYTHRYALRGAELDNWVASIEMARATNIDEFEAAAARMGWNLGVCYGGEDGQIGFWELGNLPIRAAGADSRLPTPGTGEYEWAGFLPPKERPHMRNPNQGYIHIWNSKAAPWLPEGDDGRFGATFRTWLGHRLAASSTNITLLDMRDFNQKIFNALGARDRTQTSPDFFAPYLRAAAEVTTDPDVKQAISLMLSFNGLYQDIDADDLYDNPGLTLFRTWLQVAPDHIFGDDIGDWWTRVDEARYLRYQTSLLLRALQGSQAGGPLTFDYFNGRDRTAVVIETVQKTIKQLGTLYPGKTMVAWKLPVFWKYYDPEAKNPERVPLPGTDDSPRLSAQLRIGPVMARHNGGEGWVGLMEISPRHHALYSVVDAGGQSQFIDPSGKGNPHLTDQSTMHETNELKKISLDPEEIQATAVLANRLQYSPASPR